MKRSILTKICALCSTLLFAACGLLAWTGCSSNGETSESVGSGEHVHALSRVSECQPTCEAEGNITYWTCDCGAFFLDETGTEEVTEADVKVAKKAHVLTKVEGIEPTRISNGVMEHWICSSCDGYFSDAEGTEKITQADTVLFSVMSIPDFVVEVPVGRDPVVLQLTDTQIIDAAQARPGRTGADYNFWATDQVEERCYDYVTETIEAANPDLIILTGDIVYGEFDDSGTALLSFIEFMDSFQIPWAPVFGNHDNESKKGVDWQCDQFENAEYCLFDQKELTGNGNYSVAIAQDGEIKRVFYMLDSNGCGAASAESKANGHTKTTAGFGQDQVQWYTDQIETLKEYVPDVKISFAYHIQQAVFAEAYAQYGFTNSGTINSPINIDNLTNKADGDFGYIGRDLKGPWDTSKTVYNGMKVLGADSIFVGHEHCNSASVVYDGIRFQYGQKSSEYDRFNCLNADGSITGGYSKTGTSLIGGTVIVLSETDATIKDAYIYLCGGVDISGGKEDDCDTN